MESGFFHSAFFACLAGLTLGGALLAAFARRLIHAIFALLALFLGIAGLYVYLSADFLAAVQIILYAGGILVLLIFGVMLTHDVQDARLETTYTDLVPGVILSGGLFMALVNLVFKAPWPQRPVPPWAPTTTSIGKAFVGEYLVAFEYASIVLLLAVIGATVIARKEVE